MKTNLIIGSLPNGQTRETPDSKRFKKTEDDINPTKKSANNLEKKSANFVEHKSSNVNDKKSVSHLPKVLNVSKNEKILKNEVSVKANSETKMNLPPKTTSTTLLSGTKNY